MYLLYHYGFHLLGASLMKLGGMFPWSAFDLAKGILWGYAVVLAALLGRRYAKNLSGGVLFAGVLVFAAGTRYLLLLMPAGILLRADELITLQGTSAYIDLPFSQALLQGWTIDGGPPVPYIFGFLSGIMEPFIMFHAGPANLGVVILLLFWLIASRPKRAASLTVFVVLLAVWALAWETSYALFVLGVGVVLLINWRQEGWGFLEKQWGLAVLVSTPVVLFQGGTITEIFYEAVPFLGRFYQRTSILIPPVAMGAGKLAKNILAPS